MLKAVPTERVDVGSDVLRCFQNGSLGDGRSCESRPEVNRAE